MTRAHTKGGKGDKKKAAAPTPAAKPAAKGTPKGGGKGKKKDGDQPTAAEQLEALAPRGTHPAVDEAEAKNLIDYPFLNTPAVPGGTIIGRDDRKLERTLTHEDLKSAQEELNNVGKTFRDAQRLALDLTAREKDEHQRLLATRASIRKAEEDQLEAGSEMATYCEELQTGTRKRTVAVVKTLTPGMEVVFTAADTGEEIDRRTATKEEMEAANGKSAQLFGVGNAGGTPPARPAGTTDSPDDKHNPDLETVTVSVSIEGSKKAPKSVRKALYDQPLPGQQAAGEDAEVVSIMWLPHNPANEGSEEGRSYAKVPRWLARQLGVVGEGCKVLEFKVEPTPAATGVDPAKLEAQQGLLSTLGQRGSVGELLAPPDAPPFDDDPSPRQANS